MSIIINKEMFIRGACCAGLVFPSGVGLWFRPISYRFLYHLRVWPSVRQVLQEFRVNNQSSAYSAASAGVMRGID